MDAKEKVIKIVSTFGMKYATASEAMGISCNTFKKNLSDNATRNWFNDKNVEDLKKFIAEKAEEIKEL